MWKPQSGSHTAANLMGRKFKTRGGSQKCSESRQDGEGYKHKRALSTPILAPVREQGCGNEGQRKKNPEQMAAEEYGNSEGQSQAGKPTRGPGASQPPGSRLERSCAGKERLPRWQEVLGKWTAACYSAHSVLQNRLLRQRAHCTPGSRSVPAL